MLCSKGKGALPFLSAAMLALASVVVVAVTSVGDGLSRARSGGVHVEFGNFRAMRMPRHLKRRTKTKA